MASRMLHLRLERLRSCTVGLVRIMWERRRGAIARASRFVLRAPCSVPPPPPPWPAPAPSSLPCQVWKDEAFELWTSEWGALYEEGSASRALLQVAYRTRRRGRGVIHGWLSSFAFPGCMHCPLFPRPRPAHSTCAGWFLPPPPPRYKPPVHQPVCKCGVLLCTYATTCALPHALCVHRCRAPACFAAPPQAIRDSWYLVSVVDNDYVAGDLFKALLG